MAPRETAFSKDRNGDSGGHRRARFFVVCLWLLTAAASMHASETEPFVGTWQHVGGETEEAGLLSAIEHCVAELNFLIRPLARSRLVKSSPIPDRVVIQTEAALVSVTQGNGPALSSPLGSVLPVTSPEGETIELSYRLQQDSLVQRVENGDGARQTIYRAVAGGKRLTAEVTTTSRFFSSALVYTLTFERVGSGQVSQTAPAPVNPSL